MRPNFLSTLYIISPWRLGTWRNKQGGHHFWRSEGCWICVVIYAFYTTVPSVWNRSSILMLKNSPIFWRCCQVCVLSTITACVLPLRLPAVCWHAHGIDTSLHVKVSVVESFLDEIFFIWIKAWQRCSLYVLPHNCLQTYNRTIRS